MSDKKQKIRDAVLGADRAFKVMDGGKGGGGDPRPDQPDDDDCPVHPLGHADGVYWFLDVGGQPRKLAARELGNRNNLVSLFGGDDAWPRRQFPVTKEFKDPATNEKVIRTVDFRVNALAQYLIARASRRGLWGKSVTLRQPGVWRGEDGLPIVHCGDSVLVADVWKNPGFRTGKQIWVAAEAIARPGTPCDPSIARSLQQDFESAWEYKNTAAGIALIGLLYSGWLCGALFWRLNGFVTGPAGSGKSALLRAIRACWLVHDYSNDTSKAGMEQTIASRAIPSLIDEASDRNHSAGRDLLDIVLSSSGDEGTKLARGTVDGKGRTAEIVSSVIMFSIYPPPLQPQHLGRFVLIELEQPPAGADGQDNHRRIAEFARTHAPGLWGRAIGALERYNQALMMFRTELAAFGCSPREMDSKGALLAGWYVMTNDGLPNLAELREGIAALGGFLVTSAQAEADDAPQRALGHLLDSRVQLHRSTDKEPIGELLEIAFGIGDEARQPAAAAEVLARNGIRPVLACLRSIPPPDGAACSCYACCSRSHKPVPRLGRGAGVWIAHRHPSLVGIFQGTDFDDGKWMTALARCRDAQVPSRAIHFSGHRTARAIWLPKQLILPPDEEPPDPRYS